MSKPQPDHEDAELLLRVYDLRREALLRQARETLRTELEQMLLSLASEDGELLVQDVGRTAADAASARDNPLPDLVVHWRDAAFSSSLKIKGSKVPAQMVGKKSTGQHTTPGFCIYRGEREWGRDGVVDAKDLHRMIEASV